jgi:hypothetical protein
MTEIKPRGRVPEFYSQTCRQRAYEKRKWAPPAAVELVARELAPPKVQAVIRAESRAAAGSKEAAQTADATADQERAGIRKLRGAWRMGHRTIHGHCKTSKR